MEKDGDRCNDCCVNKGAVARLSIRIDLAMIVDSILNQPRRRADEIFKHPDQGPRCPWILVE